MVAVEQIRALVETERDRFDVPGVAVAVVVDGQVVLTEGFGVRDLATGAPVTAQTLFPIASDTKCFTAAALCQLADAGLVDLDSPVRSSLPWFELADPHATALVSTRDLLAHRTGLPRHDFVWYGANDLPLVEVVRALRHLPLNKQPRQTWQYSNLCYSTAGYLTAQLTGLSWEGVITERILAPLQMTSTTFTSGGWPSGDVAVPYNRHHEAQVVPEKTTFGPPGGLLSNAEDLSRWLLARLGQVPEVLGPGALAQLHTPAMIGGVGATDVPERQPMGYALGCQVESYRGTRVVRHGGNLVGFASDVCVVPSLGVGVAVLTNMHRTGLRDALALMVLDMLLGLEPVAWGERFNALAVAGQSAKDEVAALPRAAGRPTSRPLDEFAGTYTHPAYGTLTLTLLRRHLPAEADALGIAFHDLGDRLRLCHRDRDVFEVELTEFETLLPMVFTTGPDAEVTGLTVPFEPLCPPIAFARQAAPITPGLLEKVAGVYAAGPILVTVVVRAGTVVASTQGTTLELAPTGGSIFRAPAMPTLKFEFELDAGGDVTRLVLDPLGVFSRQ